MRLSLSILPLLFAPLVAAYATHPAPRNLTARAHSTHLDARAKASSCAGLYTRNQVTCACNPGLIDPGKPKKECTCPDYPNTEVLITEVIYDDSTGTISFGSSCICLGAGQVYDATQDICECEPGYTGKRSKKNVLTCQHTGSITTTTTTVHTSSSSSTSSSASSTPTHNMSRKKKSLDEAIEIRKRDGVRDHSRQLERALECSASEQACERDGQYICTDTLSSLSTCGGCETMAMDCSALPGINTVHCNNGQCSIDSCQRGWTMQSTSFVNLPQLCTPNSKKIVTTFP